MSSELIARLEKATGPDRELDGRIKCFVGIACGCAAMCSPHYTGSIDAALPTEDIIGTSEQKQQEGQPVMWVAVHRMPKGRMTVSGRGHTEALARRIAALVAIAAAKASA